MGAILTTIDSKENLISPQDYTKQECLSVILGIFFRVHQQA